MNGERVFKILLAPHVSEKATYISEKYNQYVFKVARDSNKSEIKNAVEYLWSVKVLSVRVVNVKGKSKRFGGGSGKRSDWKKAYVSVSDGVVLDYLRAQ